MTTIVTEDSIVPLEVTDGGKSIIAEGVMIDVSDTFAISVSGIATLLRNFGDILNDDRFGITATGLNVRIDNGDTGVISADYIGVQAEFGDSAISNSGVISGDYAAISFQATYGTVLNNSGALQSDYQGVLVGEGNINARLNNYGTIEALEAGSIGVNVAETAFATKIYNIGQVLAQAFGIRNEGTASNIHNQGDISANVGIETSGDARIVNDGIISGTFAALIVEGPFSNASITNRGDMIGDIFLDTGNDKLNNTGVIVGTIETGAGNDKLNDTGDITGLIALGDGRDIYNGQTAQSAAEVDGGAGRDDLRGTAFADILMGGAGNDVLRGADGADILIGGGDRDVMVGGSGDDTFVFEDAGDSGEVFDVVTDFVTGEDRVDLSALYAGSFTFADAGLLGGGLASVWVDVKANTNAFVNIDIDGNGFRDMLVLLQRAGDVMADDFIL